MSDYVQKLLGVFDHNSRLMVTQFPNPSNRTLFKHKHWQSLNKTDLALLTLIYI